MKLTHLFFLILLLFYSCELFKDEEPQYEIVYISYDDEYHYIKIIDTESLNPKTIVQTKVNNLYDPYFLDTETIIYGADGDIYQSDLEGNAVNLTNTIYWESSYSVSETGKILYTTNYPDANEEYRWEVTLLDIYTGVAQRITYSRYFSSSPVISQDGNLFCFLTANNKYGSEKSLIIRDFNNTLNDTINKYASKASFSPDNKWICYYVDMEGLYLINLENHNSIILADYGTCPRFSPDGNFVYFTTIKDDRIVIARINIDGNDLVYFNIDQTLEGRFDISSDGEVIVFEKSRILDISSIYTIDRNGKNLTKIVDRGRFPVFRPK